MKTTSILAFLFFNFINCISQTPDISVFEHNKTSADAALRFSFIQLSDIHIGESKTGDDYGAPGYNDTLTAVDTGYDVTALRYAVQWINQNYDSLNVKFVIITGDLTDSGERSEFYKGKQILDSLKIPYVPLIGNHDVWPYTGFEESSAPNGDSVINEIFSAHFDSLQNFFSDWDNGTRLTPVYNPEASCTSRFQNFSFVYDGYLFILSDFGTRVHAPLVGPLAGPGVGPEANLMDFPSGTFYWFKQKILSTPSKANKNTFIFSHHPVTKNPIGTGGASFSYAEYDQITEYLDTLRQYIAACFAGHLHQTSTYDVSKWLPNGIITTGIETDANKEFPFGHLRIINVYDPILNIEETEKPVLSVFPNPTDGILSIDFMNSAKRPDVIEVYDVLGKLIYKDEFFKITNQMDLSHLNNGIYILRSRNLQEFYKLVLSKP